jgi:hypothetical protein
MPSRRRRRDRRRRLDHPMPRPSVVPERPKRGEVLKRAAFEERMARTRRTRTFVGMVGFVPLAAALFPVGPLADVPREIWLWIWAAIFGTFLGLTVRMWRERRAFRRTGAVPS